MPCIAFLPGYFYFSVMKTGFDIIILACLSLPAQINPANITIARDSFGVPHIFAPTDPEVAYGLAWPAEDDFNTYN
jgi:acyl-homoserine-lactone acylase